MQKARGLLIALVLCATIVSHTHPAFSEGPALIAVVFSRDIGPYRSALDGFESELKKQKRPYRLVDFNVESYSHDPDSLIARIRSKRPALVLTLGSSATEFVSNQMSDVPIVFSMVLPTPGPEGPDRPWVARTNITGATMEIPLSIQFRKIREVLPEARRVGVLFDPTVSGALVEEAIAAARLAGLVLVPMEVRSESDIVSRMEEVEGKVDVLWSIADSTVFSPQGLRHILLSTLRNRIPFVGLSPAFVKAGALLALSCDYEDIGRQSGEMAVRILDGEAPSHIPSAAPRDVSYSVNMNTARQLRVAITDEIRHAAASVF